MNAQLAAKTLNEYIDEYDGGLITREHLAHRVREVADLLETETQVASYNQGRDDEAEEQGEMEMDVDLDAIEDRDDDRDEHDWTEFDTDTGEPR